jgi:hypothetical protein
MKNTPLNEKFIARIDNVRKELKNAMKSKELSAYNKGLEDAAKLARYQVFEIKNSKGNISRWPVGKAIAKMIRSKKKKAKLKST